MTIYYGKNAKISFQNGDEWIDLSNDLEAIPKTVPQSVSFDFSVSDDDMRQLIAAINYPMMTDWYAVN